MTAYLPEGMRLHTRENLSAIQTEEGLRAAMQHHTILEARAIVCDNAHNLFVQLPCMRGMIPRTEGAIGIAEGTTKEIALISRAGKPVCFFVERMDTDENGQPIAILSRKKVQQQCWKEMLSQRKPGDILPATVTHMEKFGCFVDIGCGIPSMIPIDSISVSRISHPSDRFTVGQKIRAVVTAVTKDRIFLSHKELLGTWTENAARFSVGETVAGTVRSVEPYGVFVELAPNLAGLAEPRENVHPGQRASVYIKSLIPEKMKVKLILVDTFDETCHPDPFSYYITEPHIDVWNYAPANAARQMETRFQHDTA